MQGIISQLRCFLRLNKRDVLLEEISRDDIVGAMGQILIIDSCAFAILLVVLVIERVLNHVVVLELVDEVVSALESVIRNDTLSYLPVKGRVLLI